MIQSIIILAVSLVGILLTAELFTNAVEWFGRKLNLSEGAVGSVLAAVGTALPETTIAVVAVIAGGVADQEVGIGAILGAPMMLSTLAMFITGAAILVFARMGKREPVVDANHRIVGRDLRSFFLVFVLALVAGIVPAKAVKYAIAVFLVAAYALYVKRTVACGSSSSNNHELNPLYLQKRRQEPALSPVIFQLILAVGIMIVGAQFFKESVKHVSEAVGISALVLSLIITPIATELPEKFNSIIWVSQKKDTLALGNITGAMVFQSSITPAIGIFFTPWVLNEQAIASIVIAIAAASFAWVEMTVRARLSPYSLLVGGLLYAAYPIYIFAIR